MGYKWVGTCPVCIRCPAIANSNSNIVNTACPVPGVPQAFPALGFKCSAAFYLQEGASNAVADTCKACTAIVGGSGPITCTSASNSRAGAAFTCNTGFVLWKAGANQTIADACVPDPCAVGTNPCADGSYCQAVPDAIVVCEFCQLHQYIVAQSNSVHTYGMLDFQNFEGIMHVSDDPSLEILS